VVVSAVLWAGCASAVTGVPSNVTDSSALVGGLVGTSVGGQVEYWVEYGSTNAYGSETAHSTVTVAQGETRPVGAKIASLDLATTYHYRFCATDSEQGGAPGCGADRTVTTQSIDCGGTVTADVKLTGPLDCQNLIDGGLTIGADGVDINLAGYSFNSFPALAIRNAGHDDVTIRNGTIFGGVSTTISVSDASRNVIRGIGTFRISIDGGADNEIRHSSGAFFVSSTQRFVLADSEAQAGFGSRSSPAIRLSGVDVARIVRNDVQGGPFEPGIEVNGSEIRILENDVRDASGGNIVLLDGDGNVIRDNVVLNGTETSGPGEAQAGDGIFVGPLATGTLLRANLADSNAGDGIDVDSASTRLRENGTDGNGDLGIEAVAGVTDLGGNTAFGNGNPAQCVNVTCFPG
jgi:hypothetical protein